jgi:hypothetical protein
MFDWFRKKTTPSDLDAQIKDIHDQCITLCKGAWLDLSPKATTPEQLAGEIERFGSSATAFIMTTFPLTKHAKPYFFWQIMFIAVLESKTHPAADVNKAIDLLRSKYAN